MCGQGCGNRNGRGCREGFEAYERFERSSRSCGCGCGRERGRDDRAIRPRCERVQREGCCNRRFW